MKVVKKGNSVKNWTVKKKCHNRSCGAVLMIGMEDLRYADNGKGYAADCGDCGERFGIPDSDVPKKIQHALADKALWSSQTEVTLWYPPSWNWLMGD